LIHRENLTPPQFVSNKVVIYTQLPQKSPKKLFCSYITCCLWKRCIAYVV